MERDPLTGLYTYRYTMAILGNWLAERGSVGVILADIFHLKDPHNRYGHPPIDEVIAEVGRVFGQQAHAQDIVCRYGGDEFLMVIPGMPLQDIRQRAQQLRQAANAVRISLNGEPRENIRLSVGTAIYPPENNLNPRSTALWGVESLMQAADQDLQRSRTHYLQQEYPRNS